MAKEAKEREALLAKEAKERKIFLAKELIANPKKISGEWSGHYICGQGNTAFTLLIDAVKNGVMKATFNFYVNGSAKEPSGSFTLQGKFTSGKNFDLSPVAWIKRPSGYGMVGLKGTKYGNRLAGTIKSRTCSSFELHKQ